MITSAAASSKSCSAAQPAVGFSEPPDTRQAWKCWPARRQIPVQHYTHTRKVPLPVSLGVRINGIECTAQYHGHGKSKVAFLLSADASDLCGKILKLCLFDDLEPRLFADLSSAGLYPEIHSSNVCIEYDSVAQPVAQWYAWVTERALPMDQFLKRRDVLPNV